MVSLQQILKCADVTHIVKPLRSVLEQIFGKCDKKQGAKQQYFSANQTKYDQVPVRILQGKKGKYTNLPASELYAAVTQNQEIMYNELLNEDVNLYRLFFDIERKQGMVNLDKIIETIESHVNPIVGREFGKVLNLTVIQDSTGLQRFRIYTNLACDIDMQK